MKRFARIWALTLAMLLGVTALIGVTALMLLVSSPSVASADGTVDLTPEIMAPEHVAAGSVYMVRVVYYNFGTVLPPDAWVTASLPVGTQFISATNRWGDALPPDAASGDELAWHFVNPICKMPLDANCGHILISLHVDETLPEGETLTITAEVATTAVESDTTNNTTSAASIVNDMAGSFKKAHARYVMPADVLTYTIRISPAQRFGGGTNGRLVTLTDSLPFSHQLRFLGWRGTVTGTQIDGHKLSWEGQVRAGEPLTLQYRLGVEGVVTPGTVITNVAHLHWGGRHIRLGPVTTVVTLPHGMLALGPTQGGQLRHQYGATLTVPPDAVSETTRFQLRPLFTVTRPISPPGGLLFAHRAFEINALRFGEHVRQFSRPLTITVHYTDVHVAGLKRQTLRLWTREGPEGPWAKLGEPAGVMSGALAFTTTHLSQFALFAEPNAPVYLPMIVR
jgi:hypothetical protein